MGFHTLILDYLQKRKAEKEAKRKGLRGLIVLICGSVGTFLGAVITAGLALLVSHSSLAALLPLSVLPTTILTLIGVVVGKLFVWPRLQRLLAEKDDPFNYPLYLEDVLENRLEIIRTSKVGARTKELWERQAFEQYFEEMRKNEAQISLTREQIRHQRRVMAELEGLESDLTWTIAQVKQLASRNPAAPPL
jgi:hypothetical protein